MVSLCLEFQDGWSLCFEFQDGFLVCGSRGVRVVHVFVCKRVVEIGVTQKMHVLFSEQAF